MYSLTKEEKAKWEEIKLMVHIRDKFTCQRCGKRKEESKKGVILKAHHILSKSRGGEATMDNLVTLCSRCERRLHKHIKNPKMLKKLGLDIFVKVIKKKT